MLTSLPSGDPCESFGESPVMRSTRPVNRPMVGTSEETRTIVASEATLSAVSCGLEDMTALILERHRGQTMAWRTWGR